MRDSEDGTLPPPGPDNRPDGLKSLMRKDFWKQVELFLKRLSRMEKEVFILRFMDNLSIKEVSQVLKKSESTVKTRLYRALQKFRKEHLKIQFLQENAA